MTQYQIEIENRQYSKWKIFKKNDDQKESVNLDINTIVEYKLFNHDVFIYNEKKKNIEIIESPTRENKNIPAVLIIKGNKTYGRHSNGKLLYKCIPDDTKLPSFLVPYEMKNVGFSKVFTNMYVIINFSNWDSKHPQGIINQVIGEIDILDNFYEYQLYCKNLNTSLNKFSKYTINAINTIKKDGLVEDLIFRKYSNIEDRTDWKVFSIDPEGSIDFDDAFSIKYTNEKTIQLSIYISNVTIWLDALNIWDHFTNRVSTIYLPDKKRTMLPSILSDNYCSLLSNNIRFAFTMDIFINIDEESKNYEIIDIKYCNSKINIYKNFIYEEPKLLKDNNYILLKKTTINLSKNYKYIDYINDSHHIVEYLMIMMNHFCSKKLLEKKNGIFRSVITKENTDDIPSTNNDDIPKDILQFIKILKSTTGKYIDLNQKNIENIRHDLLKIDAYIHITSPIRRLVDLLNMIQIQINMDLLELSKDSYDFYEKWREKVEQINLSMKSIKKVQNECFILDLCTKNHTLMEQIHCGFAFSKKNTINDNNEIIYEYSIYLPQIRMINKIVTRETIDLFKPYNYNLYLFNNEEKFKKKIRLQIQNP